MANYNFTHYKGDTFEPCFFTINVDMIALNLTGAVIKMQLKKQFEGAIIYEFSTENGNIQFINASLGTFKIAEQIIDVPAFNYIYDLQIIFADDSVKTWVKGNFNIVNDVTRPSIA